MAKVIKALSSLLPPASNGPRQFICRRSSWPNLPAGNRGLDTWRFAAEAWASSSMARWMGNGFPTFASDHLTKPVYLVFLNLNHPDPFQYYERLDEFLDARARVYLSVDAHNRALLLWTPEERSALEETLPTLSDRQFDQVQINRLNALDVLPNTRDPLWLAAWIDQRGDWQRWKKQFPD
jgi:hypothetical protein